MKCLVAVVAASVLVCFVSCDKWALLVAGSSDYGNYRHQADICHAYHILHNHGIPDDRIVVMMYDDIAHNEENPFPGNIINKPGGKNLYPGVLKDYTREEVTPEVFLKVLTGDEAGLQQSLGRKGKVIKSGPNDNVFVYFADHGAPGLIAFPDSELHAEDLNKAILKMHKNNQYKEMVIYIEACESGSMFDGILRKDINVYATTAANPDESSYAIYFDKKRETYLGDVYSVKWMEDSDVENLKKETLNKQFEIVKKETNTSHVCEYGDLLIGHQAVGNFQGNKPSFSKISARENKSNDAIIDAVPSEDVPIEILRRKLEVAEGKAKVELGKEYRALLRRIKETRKYFQRIVEFASDKDFYELLGTPVQFTDFKCYREGIQQIKTYCPRIKLSKNDHALRSLRSLANLCESGVSIQRVSAAIQMASIDSSIC